MTRRPALLAAAALLGSGLLALPAQAAAPAPIVVPLAAGRVVVQRSPFRLTMLDAAGRVVLAEAVPDGATPLAQVPEPRVLGSAAAHAPTRYTPLTFTVGAAQTFQQPAGQFNGNVLAQVEGGVQYAATAVQAVAAVPGGVVLTVDTDDPTGRTLGVRVVAGPDGTLQVHVAPSDPTGVAVLADSFATGPDEAFHGFGGRHDGVDQRGQDLLDYLEQENVSSGALSPVSGATPGSGGDTYQFPGGAGATYSSSPSFVSSRPYGFLLDQDEVSRFRMASDRPDAWQAAVAAPSLDYTVALGSGQQVVTALTGLTGRQPGPPLWALGSIYDREVKFPTAESGAVYYAEVLDDLAHFDSDRIPVDGYRIEGWPLLTPAQLRDVIARLHRRGTHAMLYFRAFAGSDSAGTEPKDVYQQGIDGGYFATNAAGQPYLFVDNFLSQAGLIDFSNPAAVRWWQGRLTAAMELGADGFMTDFGEQVQSDMHFADGSTGMTMHNRYPVLYQRATREAGERFEASHPGREIWWFSRAGWTSGRPGSAAYEAGMFPGDEATDFSHGSGLAAQASDMLNRAIGGQYGFTTDIGGYFDIVTPATTQELFLRWTAWAALSPFFRLHGSVLSGVHSPWSYGPATVTAYRRLAQLHQAAAPLLQRLWREADRTGVPPVRPLWLGAPGDPQAASQDQEWLLGDDVLVAPVVVEGATTRSAYLPSGCWQEQGTRQTYAGRRTVTVPAPLGSLPYFFRCGTTPFAVSAVRPPAAAPPSAPVHALPTTGGLPLAPVALVLLALATATGTVRRAGQRRRGTV